VSQSSSICQFRPALPIFVQFCPSFATISDAEKKHKHRKKERSIDRAKKQPIMCFGSVFADFGGLKAYTRNNETNFIISSERSMDGMDPKALGVVVCDYFICMLFDFTCTSSFTYKQQTQK
jgi:hypothetical protein